MRSRLGIWTALAVTLTAAGPRAEAAPPRTVCEQRCLGGYVDKVLRAMMDHDPSHAPLAPAVRYTENGEAKAPGQGFWATASAIAIEDDGLSTLGRSSSAYRLYFADAASGQAAYLGAFTEDGAPGMMMLRLKVAAGKIGEIEAVIVRKEPAGPGVLAAFDPKGFDEPEPTLLAGGERWAPSIMTAAADRYFDALQTGSSAGVPLGPDCVRRDNGVRTTGNPDLPAPDPANAAAKPFALGCAAQIDSGLFHDVLRVRRRVLVTDQGRGLVLAVAMVDHGARPEPPKAAGKKRKSKAAEAAAPPTLATDLMGVVFKMSEGKITRIEAIERAAANDASLGWPAN